MERSLLFRNYKTALTLVLIFLLPVLALAAPPTQMGSFISLLNDPVTGTTVSTLTALNSATPSGAIIAPANLTNGVIGITVAGAGSANAALIQTLGQVNCQFDNPTTAGDYVQISPTTAGLCHDAGATRPASNQTIGYVLVTNGAIGTNTIHLSVQAPSSAIPLPVSFANGGTNDSYGPSNLFIQLGNSSTSTNTLTKLTGAGLALQATTSDTDGMLGICEAGCGSSGTATIQSNGIVTCAFDGATTQNDWVSPSGTVAGNCHDAGASRPSTGQSIGRVLSTNGAAGNYQMVLQLNGAGGGSSVTPGGNSGDLQKNNGSGGFGAYAGQNCVNQAITGLNSAGTPTCNTVTAPYTDNTIAKTGADLNTANQVTSTHLASPLPAAQGGTQCASPVTFAALPSGAATGSTCAVTNASACNIGTAVTASGSPGVFCQVVYNGTLWQPAGGATGGGSGTAQNGVIDIASSVCNDTDDGGVIQAAFNTCAANAARTIVRFPTNATCKPHANLTLDGRYCSIDGRGVTFDFSAITSGTHLSVTGAAANPTLYTQNVDFLRDFEIAGAGSGNATTGLLLGTTTMRVEGVNVHDTGTGISFDAANTYADTLIGVEAWNAVTAVTTGSDAPSQSGETISWYNGIIFNSTTGISMLNTGNGFSFYFSGTGFDGMTGSTFVLATGASETAALTCSGCHVEYTASHAGSDLMQVGGSNSFTRIFIDGSVLQADGNINSIVNSTGSGYVYIHNSFVATGGSYTTARVTGSNAAKVTISDSLDNANNHVTNGTNNLNDLSLNSPLKVASGGTQCGVPTTVAGLPGSPTQGQICNVTDADTCTAGTVIVHTSGSTKCQATWNGTSWLPAGGASSAASGGVTAVNASAPITSTGGTTPTIAITTPITVALGGTQCGAPSVFASLPGSPTNGEICNVTDAPACSVGTPVTAGGGGTKCQVTYNGANWEPAGGAVAALSSFLLATNITSFFGGI